MQDNTKVPYTAQGILIHATGLDLASLRRCCLKIAAASNVERRIEIVEEGNGLRLKLDARALAELTPGFDTLQLCHRLGLHTQKNAADLNKEILLTMLASPVTLEFPSCAELEAALRIRRNIVAAARRTALSFHTSRIERPEEYWTYSEETSFILRPGKPLIEALRMATQPATSERQYAFSCYRATEYVILLGIAEELAVCNPALLQQLQAHWEAKAIMSGSFHETFLREYGSMEAPLPPRYYIPGDRVWFRNPEERSSDVEGYEGSWVLYLGDGLFTNFWNCERPYSFVEKCIEVYHWRDGVHADAGGELRMDESIVEERVRNTMSDHHEMERILGHMLRLRDPSGVYAEGGCIDRTREHPRWVCPSTSNMVLPELAAA